MKLDFIGIFMSDTNVIVCEGIAVALLLGLCIFLNRKQKQKKKKMEKEESRKEWEQLQRSLKNEKGR